MYSVFKYFNLKIQHLRNHIFGVWGDGSVDCHLLDKHDLRIQIPSTHINARWVSVCQ